ncbi:MAG: cysteine hydrolase [Sphingomonadales bacterium]|nr:MAG: cysteine hydrolase [Sphingomonadales bacterium]
MSEAHGAGPKAPDHDQARGRAAVVIVDMINDFAFPGGKTLEPKARRVAKRLLKLRAEVERAGWPVVYVNDNFGEWHSERSRLVEAAVEAGSEVARILRPSDDDYFIIKPKLSGFYATNLAVLLPKLGASRLMITGVATDMCVLFTAADAHMRDYRLWIPSDLVAGEDDKRSTAALKIMAKTMGAEIRPVSRLKPAAWLAELDREGRS